MSLKRIASGNKEYVLRSNTSQHSTEPMKKEYGKNQNRVEGLAEKLSRFILDSNSFQQLQSEVKEEIEEWKIERLKEIEREEKWIRSKQKEISTKQIKGRIR